MAANAVLRGPTSACVSENIETIRKMRGLSQAQLANELTRVGRPMLDTAVSKMERGTRRIDVDDLVALAAAFSVRPEQLLTPFECERCNGQPPAGFACRACGAEGEEARPAGAVSADDLRAELANRDRIAKCSLCTAPVLVHDDGSTTGGVDTLAGIRCDRCLDAPENEKE